MPLNTGRNIVTLNTSFEVQYNYKRIHMHMLFTSFLFLSNPPLISFFACLRLSAVCACACVCVFILFWVSFSCLFFLLGQFFSSYLLPTPLSSIHPSIFNHFIRAEGVRGAGAPPGCLWARGGVQPGCVPTVLNLNSPHVPYQKKKNK